MTKQATLTPGIESSPRAAAPGGGIALDRRVLARRSTPLKQMRLEAIPGVEELRDLAPPLAGGKLSLGIATIGRLPRRLRYALPVFQVLQARLREPAQEGVATSA